MTREEVVEKLADIFREVFDDEDIVLTDKTTAKDIVGWDSLMHITLISEIESEFDIRFHMKDAGRMRNIGEMVDRIIELKHEAVLITER